MTIALTTTGSGLLYKLGNIAGWFFDIQSARGGTATTNVASGAQTPVRLAQLQVDYGTSVADYLTPGPYLPSGPTSFQSALGTFLSTLQSLATDTVVNQANADTPLVSKTLQNALTLLVNQMVANSNTIQATVPAVGTLTAYPGETPVGTPVFPYSVKDGAGRTLQYVYPEKLTVLITGDVQTGSTGGQEPYSITGQNAQSDMLAFDWLSSKYGSGCAVTGNLIDGSVSSTGGSTGNLTVNGDFRVYTNSNIGDNWIALVGTIGTHIVNGAGTSYLSGGGSIEFAGDGSTLTSIAQTFATTSSTSLGAGGSPAVLVAGAINNAVYLVNLSYKLSASSPAAGVLRISLVDGTNTIITDDQSVAQSTTVALTGVADTSWHQLNTSFRLPQALPTTIKLRIDLSTALTNTKNVFISNVGMALGTQLYQGGPYVVGFSGTTKVNASGLYPDAWTNTVTNTVSSTDIRTVTTSFQRVFWQLFNIPQYNLIIPNAGSPSITDSSYIT